MVIAWASAGLGCAQERGAINQVQANALSKHFFAGANLSDPSDDPEFYMRNTVDRRSSTAPTTAGYRAGSSRRPTAAAPHARQRVPGDQRDRAHRASDLRSHQGLGLSRRRSDRTTARWWPCSTSPASFPTTSPLVQPADRRRAEHRHGEHDRPALVPARLLPRRLVEEPRHRRLRGRHARSCSASSAPSPVDPEAVLSTIPSEPRRAGLRSGPRLLRHHDQGVRHSPDRQHALRHLPGLLPPPDVRGSTGVRLQLQPDRGHAASRVPAGSFRPTTSPWTGTATASTRWLVFTTDRLGYDRNNGIVDQKWHRFASRC